MALSFRICLIRTVTAPEILRNLLFGLACIRRLLKLIVACLIKTSYQCSFMAFVTAVWLHSLPVYKSRKMIIFFHLICSWYLPAFVGLSGESAPSCSSTSCCSRVLVACCLFFSGSQFCEGSILHLLPWDMGEPAAEPAAERGLRHGGGVKGDLLCKALKVSKLT